MAVKITYFVHGTTVDNENGISSGWSDTELSELGIKQSIELWNMVKDRKIDIVFCSDLKRAVQSAELTFENRIPIVRDSRLRECNYGEYNGKMSSVVEPLQEKHIHKRFPGGESYDDVKDRMEEFLKFLRENYDERHVGIVSHKAPQLALDVVLKGMTWKQAFERDWRKRKAWQPGWEYKLE